MRYISTGQPWPKSYSFKLNSYLKSEAVFLVWTRRDRASPTRMVSRVIRLNYCLTEVRCRVDPAAPLLLDPPPVVNHFLSYFDDPS